MAIKGLSKPVCAEYVHNGSGVVTYSNMFAADTAAEYSVEIEAAENNDLYTDNRIQESAGGKFTSGSLTLKTGDLEPKLSMKLLGLKEVEMKVGENTVKEIVSDDDQNVPYLGFGIIEEHQINQMTKYLPIVFPKVRFNIPVDAATTRGSTIEWQTKEIKGQIMRSDQEGDLYNHPWRRCPAELYATEAEAFAYLEAVLGPVTTKPE